MKTLIVVILFSFYCEVLSQTDYQKIINNSDNLEKRLNSDSAFKNLHKHPLKPDNFLNSDFEKRICKAIPNNGPKTVEFIHQKWDSSNWINTVKETSIYDDNHNLVEYLWQIWRNSNWVNSSIQICIYDGNNNRIESLFQKWDGSNWLNDLKQTFSYDENNNLVEWLYQSWGNSNWVNYSKRIYTYDENDCLIIYLYQRWSTSDWINIKKYSFIYDENSNMIEHLWLSWVNSSWINNWRYTFFYDENSNMTKELLQNWVNSNWVNDWKWTYTQSNNEFKKLWEDWNGFKWVSLKMYTRTHDENNNLIEYCCQNCDCSNLINYRKRIYIYDGNNKAQELWLKWDGSKWVKLKLYAYTYDENNNLTNGLCQNWSGTKWVNYEKYTYTYINFPTTVEKEENITYKLSNNYPNPFNPSTTIKYQIPHPSTDEVKGETANLPTGKAGVKLVVFDVLGREVATLVNEKQKPGYYEVKWNAVNNSSGVYFYQIRVGDPSTSSRQGFIDTKKMILLR